MVAAIVAGDPAGLAAAYDHYAPALYAYCRSLLTEPADAADAVQDTFVVASGKLAGLRDPDRLRPWLYAVARNECRRWLRDKSSRDARDVADERMDETAVFSTALVKQAGLREIVRAALGGLNPGEREVVELSMRHEFYGADLADALGVPLNQAHAMAARARTQFETLLGALLVARSGQASCPGLADVLADWDGHLTVLLHKQVKRHIERCAICSERRRRELSPAALLGMLPAAVLPAGLRAQVLRLVADDRPDAVAYRADVEDEAEPFARSGFPLPLDPLAPVRGLGTYMPAAGAAVAAIAVLGGGIMFAADFVHHHASARTTMAAAGPPRLPSAVAAPAAATPSSKTGQARSAQAAQATSAPTSTAPSSTKKRTTASPKPTTPKPTSPRPTSPKPTSPKPTSPVPTTTKPTSPVPTTTKPTGPATSSPATALLPLSVQLGLAPVTSPLLSGVGVVTSAVVIASPAGLPGTLYLVLA